MGIQKVEPLLRQAREPPIEGGAIGDDLAGAFLERDKNPRRPLPARGVDDALEGETVLPAPGPPMRRLVRWRGKPPRLNWSNPRCPWRASAELERLCFS
jgi:hypothetical protein